MSLGLGKLSPAQLLQRLPLQPIANHKAPLQNPPLSDLQDIYTYYVAFFGDPNSQIQEEGSYEKVRNHILQQFNVIMRLLGDKTYHFPLNLQSILDEQVLPEAEATCAWGNKAYKDYLRSVVNKANTLYNTLVAARAELQLLDQFIKTHATESEAAACVNNLGMLKRQAAEITEAFTQFREIRHVDAAHYAYEKWLGEERLSLLSESTYTQAFARKIDLTTPFQSKITAKDSVSLDTLRQIQTEKYNYTLLTVSTYYRMRFKEDEEKILTDRFDPNAWIEVESSEEKDGSQSSVIAVFDEFTLLDKLKYIILYYTLDGDRYVFPNNQKEGCPCIPTPESTSIVKDTEEIGRAELFFIGYLAEHYNAIYALAVFMEIKVNALLEQTKMVQKRIEALKFYLNLINRGFQELNKSQANGNANISNAAYCALRYLGANITRTVLPLTINGETSNYVVLQGVSNNPVGAAHYTNTGNYLLVKTTNEAIQSFIAYVTADWCRLSYSYDHIFNYNDGHGITLQDAVSWGYLTKNQLDELCRQGYNKGDRCTVGLARTSNPIQEYPNIYRICYQCRHRSRGTEWKKEALDPGLYILQDPNHMSLPKELETNRLDISPILVKNYAGSENTWNAYKNDNQGSWTGLLKCWRSSFETTIENTETQVTSVQKTVSTFRNKISTFESNASACAKKINLMYNQIVNKI